MDWLVIEGVRPWDGRYDLDIVGTPLTRREWGWIKKFTGYLPLTWWEGLKGGDADLYAAFAVIALHRAGRITPDQAADVFDRFADVDVIAAIRWELDQAADQEADADGPPPPRQSGNGGSSGDATTTSSEISPPTPLPTGDPPSDTSEPALVTWAR